MGDDQTSGSPMECCSIWVEGFEGASDIAGDRSGGALVKAHQGLREVTMLQISLVLYKLRPKIARLLPFV